MNQKKIISKSEVRHYARVPSNFPDCNLEVDEKFIKSIFDCRQYLTLELYDRMIEDLIPYDDVQEYDYTQQYTAGSLVVYNHVVYEAIRDTELEPNCESDWKPAPKFEKDCFNELWCEEGLAEYISLCIYHERLPETMTAETYEDKKSFYAMVFRNIKSRMKAAWNCLCKFIRECDDPNCFEGIGGQRLSCGCISKCRCGEINTFGWGIY